MSLKIELSLQSIADGKRLYEKTATPTGDIADMMGISLRTLRRRAKEWGWAGRSDTRMARRQSLLTTVSAAFDPVAVDAANVAQLRSANAARIQGIVSQTLDGIQRVLDNAGPSDESGAERSARTFAAVARTLQSISPLTVSDEGTSPHEDDDPVPLDIDEFRYELARRIRGFVESERRIAGEISAQPEGALE